MHNQRHIIEKQTLHIRYHEGIGAGKLQKMLSDWLNNSLQPAMEALFNELNRSGYKLRMDQLEINAGDILGNNWQQQLTEKVCSELRNKIRSSPVAPLELAVQTTVYSDVEKYELVRYYVKHGQLPWYADGVATNALFGWMNSAIGDGFFTRDDNCSFLTNNADALQRLLLQARPNAIETWFTNWNRSLTREWMEVLSPVAKDLFDKDRWAYAVLFERLAGLHPDPLWQKMLKEKWNANDALSVVYDKTNELLQDKLSLGDWKKEIVANQPKLEEKPVAQNDNSEGVFYIQNAGLVILHPFLPAFFTNLSLLKDGEWINEDAHNKAVLILQYLATASLETAEYELPLCKLLCGWSITKPLDTTLSLNYKEKKECRLMLQQLIDHWSILKKTSIEGLQQNFLRRSGKLSEKGDSCLLQVEQQTIDILLDHLPWTISVAKSSLMHKVLYTEWT